MDFWHYMAGRAKVPAGPAPGPSSVDKQSSCHLHLEALNLYFGFEMKLLFSLCHCQVVQGWGAYKGTYKRAHMSSAAEELSQFAVYTQRQLGKAVQRRWGKALYASIAIGLLTRPPPPRPCSRARPSVRLFAVALAHSLAILRALSPASPLLAHYLHQSALRAFLFLFPFAPHAILLLTDWHCYLLL